jgi:peptidoglycan/LPS O-acetylase OafA/YrhL
LNNSAECQANPASANATSPPLLSFRPDIEGLRAVAILIVVACHAQFVGFDGGFIGVDVFFVLSGFLITGLLVNEFYRTGKIQLADFYARRLKRLLPALLLMTCVTLLVATVLLSPAEQMLQATTAVAVPLWATNFHFSLSAVDYFAATSDANLFLHTWSLAVEEQFYLVWPVLVLFLFGAFGAVSGSGITGDGTADSATASSRKLIRGMLLTIGVGFLLSLFLSYAKPLWGFYLMPSRAWQFALGGLVCMLAKRDSAVVVTASSLAIPHSVYTLAGWTGLSLIVGAVMLLSEAMIYPGFGALLPSLGAALLLFAGSAARPTTVTRLLSLPPLQLIGKVSYSWYLWHWPVLVLGKAALPNAGLLQVILLVLLSLVLAFVSLFTVEAPIRHNRFLTLRPTLTIVMSVALMGSVFVLGLLWQQKAEGWSQLEAQTRYQQVRRDLPVIYSMGCDDWYATPRVRPCSFGNNDADKTAVLLGDSVGAQWFSALAMPLVEQGWRFVVLTKSACPIVDEPIFYARIGMEYTVCSDWRKAALGFLAELKPDLIFMGSASTYDYTPQEWQQGTNRVLEVLAPATQKLYIMQGSYRLPFDGPDCLARRDWQPALLHAASDCTGASADSNKDVQVAAALQQAAAAYSNVGVLNLNPLICPDGRCAAQLGEHIVFRDFQHIADRFVRAITPQVQSSIDKVQFK